jgi:hypothetical protein
MLCWRPMLCAVPATTRCAATTRKALRILAVTFAAPAFFVGGRLSGRDTSRSDPRSSLGILPGSGLNLLDSSRDPSTKRRVDPHLQCRHDPCMMRRSTNVRSAITPLDKVSAAEIPHIEPPGLVFGSRTAADLRLSHLGSCGVRFLHAFSRRALLAAGQDPGSVVLWPGGLFGGFFPNLLVRSGDLTTRAPSLPSLAR